MSPRALKGAVHRPLLAAMVVLAVAAVVAGCSALPPLASLTTPVRGEGTVQTETRSLAAFDRVSVGSGMKVVIGAGAEPSVTVAAQPNLLPLIKTVVVDGQLVVTTPPPGVSSTEPITLTLAVPALTSVALSAGATGYVEHTGGPLNVDVSGGSTLKAIGTTPELTVTASSGAKATLGELKAANGKVNANDGASAELNVTGTLTGVAEGGATVMLTTKPATLNVATKSGGTVQGG
jgi:hypothetical protein